MRFALPSTSGFSLSGTKNSSLDLSVIGTGSIAHDLPAYTIAVAPEVDLLPGFLMSVQLINDIAEPVFGIVRRWTAEWIIDEGRPALQLKRLQEFRLLA